MTDRDKQRIEQACKCMSLADKQLDAARAAVEAMQSPEAWEAFVLLIDASSALARALDAARELKGGA